jgi:cobalamin biosynthesis protein CbiD
MTLRDRNRRHDNRNVAANAPDNAEGAAVRLFASTHKAIQTAHAAGDMTDEQHKEAIRNLLIFGHSLAASPAIQAERPASRREVN